MGSQHEGIIDNQFLIEQSSGSDDNQGNSDSDTKVFNFIFFLDYLIRLELSFS